MPSVVALLLSYLCYSVAGEWTKYTVVVAQAGTYSVGGTMAVPQNGGFNLSFGGNITTGNIALAITPTTHSGTGESFHSWDTRSAGDCHFPHGGHVRADPHSSRSLQRRKLHVHEGVRALTRLVIAATFICMNVLFTSLREKSHFLPLLPFIEAFQKQGHAIAVAAPIDFAQRVAATGAEFFPFGHPGDEGLRPIWMRLRDAAPEDTTRIAIGELFAGACAGAALASALETIQRWRPAIIVRESCEFAGFIAAEKLGIPHLRVAISARGAEDEVRTYAAAAVDAHRRSVGLSPDPSGERIRAEASLSLFPRSFDALETEPAELIRFRAERKQASPLPSWWGERKGPFVYVTLGTVAGGFDKLHAAYQLALDTVADLPIRVLLTIGSDLPQESLGEIPPNVHVERFVPQDDVLPHAAAVLCHGGSGTVVGALAAGVPMVVAPMFADQPHNAARVAAIGAGLAMPTRDLTAVQLRAALTRVLQEASFREASQRISREIATLPPVAAAGIELERLARG